jgi:hypothetical protein
LEQEKKSENLLQKQIDAQPYPKSNIKAWTPLIKKIEPVDKKEIISDIQHKITPLAVLNPESTAFVPTFIPSLPKIS